MLRISMFGLAAAAACMPCHAVWLNDLSLMPPVSVTMQARNLPPAAALVLAGALAVAPPPAAELEAPLAGALDELLPQAASSSAADAVAAAVSNEVSLTDSPPHGPRGTDLDRCPCPPPGPPLVQA